MSDATRVPTSARLERILPLLACPACRQSLARTHESRLTCRGCGACYPVRGEVPILLPASLQEPGVGTVDTSDPVSRHPYSPSSQDIINAHQQGWVLDLGAGGKLQRWENVLQVDIFRYPMTDVVATADCLPFRDNAFQAVISQAVFEHLQYPEAAAAEIRRVLQPQGILKIDTAFLQPEHGYPHHFFNATETGLRHWFRDFDIRWSGVEPYQHPQWSLSWFLGVYLDRIGPEHAQVLRQARLDQLLMALERRARGEPQADDSRIVQALDALPAHEWRTLAAGVSVQGRNPAKLSAAAEAPSAGLSHGMSSRAEDTRALIAARAEIHRLNERLQSIDESRTVALDRGNYFRQYIPSTPAAAAGWATRLRIRLVVLLRRLFPPTVWNRLRRWRRTSAGQQDPAPSGGAQPFLSVVTEPCDLNSFVNLFFSMTHQTFTGWELVVIRRADQSTEIRRAMHDFKSLDHRVNLVDAFSTSQPARLHEAQAAAAGRFIVNLPEGAVLAHRAVQTLYTLVRSRPQTHLIVADFERADSSRWDARGMVCHGTPLDAAASYPSNACSFAVHASRANAPVASASAKGAIDTAAYIPEVLFRQVPVSPAG